MSKVNCWEFKNCGRTDCPAMHETKVHGVHGGMNAGRACWVVAGTRCKGEVQGDFAKKQGNCSACDFYLSVQSEERMHFTTGLVLLKMLE